ncbi:hypoxanthine phosphoribosyltransferase [Limosilactobacillus fastidiosus]|uniref:Hypoxanthine phosphoribosyltransferase n=1 Tax=Limosilactobacillus fastidiosus TaxID=2759855 RepID=A0A7W3YCB2_9LACO|nr:hypoxanthine phosphoribosyltransferase [Limosilactobacillus fastidiosus]MBB1062235.1 hypoxanthine phosphoribosyltransferase [Limosilactobacillus fastidiosus]MBB1086564.1 hypoxanthine phosphoribosyltransferase [Limosilactobacillus fastidiosus]MCD7084393.1 hypoxanthine phosphoribosyltransferase [Limosilactobacillus fastidiosus]MCD7086540.1 hypoxanthine phosphoribosyltransferase [Limosilactobacillus fastidiosus]MCD7115248.1 hypoxanthine phosphoribosyltransferase [Limosilactobacillus fastidiosu
MNNDIERVLYSEEEINRRMDELAKQLTAEYREQRPLIISVMTGAVLFTVDMIKRMDIMAKLDFIDVSSYYGGTSSTGEVKLVQDLKSDIRGRSILIMEDIVDTGHTLKFLIELLKERGAKSVKVCTLLDKPEGRQVEVKADYVGFNVPNEFLVGYGLDYKGYYRNLPYVGILKPAVYEKD